MRAVAWSALALALWTLPALAFENEYRSGPFGNAHGHGLLVSLAAAGTEFEPHVRELADAQRELDFPGAASGEMGLGAWLRALVDGCAPSEQEKHFLRWYSGLPAWRAVTRPLAQDWAHAVAYVRQELKAARAARDGATERRHLGHALHALQDSYSPAHVHRSPEGRIRELFYYPSPRHQVVDAGDHVRTAQGELTPEARQAVAASHALLAGYGRWRAEPAEAFDGFVASFEASYLALEGP